VIRNALLVAVGIIAIVAGYLVLKPADIAVMADHGVAAASWDEAVARVRAIQAEEAADPAVREDCRTRLYDHGAPTANVVVLFHGYTNCPKQYDQLAQELADRGDTVLVPRMPHHGIVPGTPGLLDSLTGEQVIAHADEAMNIADGLGDRVTVFGLSGGGAVASYIAQFRADADLVIPAAAFLDTGAIPTWAVNAAINLIDLLPPIDQRDPPPDEATRGAYPHGASDTSTHGAASYMRAGQTVLDAAATQAPKAGRIITVVNDADTTVNNTIIDDLAGRWARLAPDRTSLYRFDASLNVLHDMITPDRDGQKTDLVYPVLIDLMSRS
jgi:alpha-beta hydrolase superfamily lysophospholipase